MPAKPLTHFAEDLPVHLAVDHAETKFDRGVNVLKPRQFGVIGTVTLAQIAERAGKAETGFGRFADVGTDFAPAPFERAKGKGQIRRRAVAAGARIIRCRPHPAAQGEVEGTVLRRNRQRGNHGEAGSKGQRKGETHVGRLQR